MKNINNKYLMLFLIKIKINLLAALFIVLLIYDNIKEIILLNKSLRNSLNI